MSPDLDTSWASDPKLSISDVTINGGRCSTGAVRSSVRVALFAHDMEAAAVKKMEDEERERKREAIRRRIEEAKRSKEAQEQPAQRTAAVDETDHKAPSGDEVRYSDPLQEHARSRGFEHRVEDYDFDERPPGREPGTSEDGFPTSYFEEHLPLPLEEAGASEGITYKTFDQEDQMAEIVALIDKDLSEPYSIFTYRYFVYKWPQHTHMAMYEGKCAGVVVCKLEQHRDYLRGYIAMLAVDKSLRGKGIGTCLVSKGIRSMREETCQEVVLETECSNTGALRLYENLGFYRDKRLLRYYLNGGDAFRLKLWFPGVEYYT